MTEPRQVADPDPSPALGAGWYPSRWGAADQRGNGNLLGPQKVAQALALVRSGEIVRLGHPYDARIPLAPGRIYGLRMPGGPTGGPHGGRSRTVWNDEFLATEIGQIGTHMDALGHLGRQVGEGADHAATLFYNGNSLAEIWSAYGLKRLGIEHAPIFFTRGILIDVQAEKGRPLNPGEEITADDLRPRWPGRAWTRPPSPRAMQCWSAPVTARGSCPTPPPSTTAARAWG